LKLTVIILITILAFTIPIILAAERYSLNWAGFSFYKPSQDGMVAITYAAARSIEVSYLSLPPSDQIIPGVPIAIVTWVGVSPENDGTPVLIQGGWGGLYDGETYTFDYFTWVEIYPYFPVLRTKVPAEPGDDIDVIVRKEDLFTWSITIYNPYREPSSVTYPFETEDPWPDMFYAHFILEAPIVNGQLAQLPKFNDEYFYMVYIGHVDGSGNYGTYYYNNGWYIKSIIKQGNYINTGVEYIPYPEDDDVVHVWWITSKR